MTSARRDRHCWCGQALLFRDELDNRRGGYNFEFVHSELTFKVSVRGKRDGLPPTEVFLNCSKISSLADLISRDAACVISIALQFGVPLSELAHAMGRDDSGSATSPIGKLLDILTGKEEP